MKRNDYSEDNLIDKLYNEEYDKASAEAETDSAFNDKLLNMSEVMEALKDGPEALSISFFDIIEKAEKIKDIKKQRKENLLFLSFASSILYLFGLMAYITGEKFVIGFSIVAFALLPFSLIPLSKSAIEGWKNSYGE